MTRITLQDIKMNLGITNTYDIVNSIRNSAGDGFKNYVPLATAENVAEVGAGIMINQTVQNEFISNLVDRIGKVVVHQTSLKNQLKKFKKGNFPLGRTIEEIFTDITKAKKYDPEDAETTVFRRELPNVKTLFHERSRQDRYDQTIQDESLKMAFTSWDNLGSFMASVLNAVYNSAEVDEYEYMKLLVDNYYSKGLFTVVPIVNPDTETAAKEFVKKLRATAMRMTLPTGTRDYNSLAVRTRSDMSDLHLLIDSELQATLDVDVLASAFNMGKTDFLGHVTIIDGFASSGLEAVLVDKDFFMVYDNLFKMETIRNPKGLYWNYFLHVWQTLSVSRFANAVAFVTGSVKKVTQVIVDPTILSIKPERTHQFTAYVRTTVKEEFPVTWKVVAGTGSTLAAGTSISATGLLTVGATQTGTLSVTASVNRGTTQTPELVTGESIVTIVPKN